MNGEYKSSLLFRYFALLSGATLLLYLATIALLTGLAAPLKSLFMSSCVVIAFLSTAVFFVVRKFFGQYYSVFTTTMLVACIGLGLFVFSVFGPVFVDRSISYHLILFASRHGEISIAKLQQSTARQVYRKRIQEASATGLLIKETDDVYKPTAKAIWFARVISLIGVSTNSLGEYRQLEADVAASDAGGR